MKRIALLAALFAAGYIVGPKRKVEAEEDEYAFTTMLEGGIVAQMRECGDHFHVAVMDLEGDERNAVAETPLSASAAYHLGDTGLVELFEYMASSLRVEPDDD